MADEILKNQLICTKIGIRGFLGSLITNLRSDLGNSKWRIQDGERNLEKSTDLLKNQYKGVFGVADHESEVRFTKFKMAHPRWRTKF